MKSLRSKLTYANVISTLALFLVVAGGSAIAAGQLAKNSVGTKQIKNNAITAAKIKSQAVTGAKINLGSLGTVPSATHSASADTAANAQALEGQSVAQITGASKLGCPAGTIEVAVLCFEKTPRASNNYFSAIETCAKAGRTLPSMSEMDTFDIVTNNTSPAEWVGQLFFDGSELRAEAITKSSTNASKVFGEEHPYRCAVPPAN